MNNLIKKVVPTAYSNQIRSKSWFEKRIFQSKKQEADYKWFNS